MLLLIVEYVLIRQSGEKRGIEVTPTLSAQSHGKVTVKPLDNNSAGDADGIKCFHAGARPRCGTLSKPAWPYYSQRRL